MVYRKIIAHLVCTLSFQFVALEALASILVPQQPVVSLIQAMVKRNSTRSKGEQPSSQQVCPPFNT